jgi:hypothetical protein
MRIVQPALIHEATMALRATARSLTTGIVGGVGEERARREHEHRDEAAA